jgi:hypothetical protein
MQQQLGEAAGGRALMRDDARGQRLEERGRKCGDALT